MINKNLNLFPYHEAGVKNIYNILYAVAGWYATASWPAPFIIKNFTFFLSLKLRMNPTCCSPIFIGVCIPSGLSPILSKFFTVSVKGITSSKSPEKKNTLICPIPINDCS